MSATTADLSTYPSMPEPDYIDTNGIRMAVHVAGPEDGLPVVLCHGWPELAFSWRHQVPALAQAGFRVYCPDQRGYGRTDKPEAVESYDIHHLTGDLVGLLDAYGHETGVFVGHDWGGIVTWHIPLLHPHRVRGNVGVNTPFIPRLSDDPIKLMRQAYGERMYIVQFQDYGVADKRLAEDTAKTFRFMMRTYEDIWDAVDPATNSGSGSIPDGRKVDPDQPGGAMEIVELATSDESLWPGRVFLSDAELKVFVDMFEKTGFTGGINWYRNFTRNWETTADMPQIVHTPGLMIMGQYDVALPPRMADGMEKYVPNLEKHVVERCGHWTQQEHPETVNRLMIDWLNRTFG